MKKVLLSLFLLLFTQQIYPQNQGNYISGNVRDADTKEYIVNANIYLANTTLGTTSDLNGNFSLTNIPDGVYDLVIRMIGFEIKTIKFQISGGTKKKFEIKLSEKPINLNEVVIKAPEPEEWKRNIKIFEREFIGETTNSRECRILNPEVINLMKTKDGLSASTDSVIIIENKSLGYLLHVVLITFNFATNPYEVHYKVLPRFEEIKSEDNLSSYSYENNRRETYESSFRHFLTHLISGVFDKELYRLTTGSFYDLQSKKGTLLSRDLLSFRVEVDDSSLITFTAPEYMAVEIMGTSEERYSILKMNSTSVLIDKYCNLLDGFSITQSGFWGKQRIADMLPFNYRILGTLK